MRWNNTKNRKRPYNWKWKFAILPLRFGDETIWFHPFQEKLLEKRSSGSDYLYRIDKYSDIYRYTYLKCFPFTKGIDRRSNRKDHYANPEFKRPEKKEAETTSTATYTGNKAWGKDE